MIIMLSDIHIFHELLEFLESSVEVFDLSILPVLDDDTFDHIVVDIHQCIVGPFGMLVQIFDSIERFGYEV